MNFAYRLLIGSTLTILTVALILISHKEGLQWVFFAGFAAILHVALYELYRMMGNAALKWTGMTFSLLFSAAVFLPSLPLALAAAVGLPLVAFLPFMKGEKGPIEGISKTVFPFVYLTLPFATGLLINEMDSLWLLFGIAVAKMADVGGYFGGKLLGKTPLAKSISPKKTVEGALAGLVCAIGTAAFFPLISPLFSLLPSLLLGLGLGIVAQYGDLSESLLKRDANVKDSGSLPGVGGMLDVVDSLVFTFPILYIYLQIGERL